MLSSIVSLGLSAIDLIFGFFNKTLAIFVTPSFISNLLEKIISTKASRDDPCPKSSGNCSPDFLDLV